jgi:hypothetical protein
MRESKLSWLDICHSPKSSMSASSWCTRRWVTGGQPSSSGTSGLSPAHQYHPTFSTLCGRVCIVCWEIRTNHNHNRNDKYMTIQKQVCTSYREVGRLIVSQSIGKYQLGIHRLDNQ